MNIIKTYIENMFASLPNTKEVNKMKQDLLLNMEEKYRELKASGKTENEAIGIVISEFGNIEELSEGLGVNITPAEISENTVSMDEAKEYLEMTKKMSPFISVGVFLCILSPILLILLMPEGDWTLENSFNTIIGFVALFVLVAIAVGLFINAGVKLEKFNHLKKDIVVGNNVKEYVKIEKNNFDQKFTIGLIISVACFILSPVTLIIFSIINDSLGFDKYNYNIGVSILLALVAIGCLIIVRLGMIKDSYNILLQIGDYTKNKKKEEKITSAIAGIYWPLVTAAFLLWSFLGNAWHISWLIWPIAGVIFGAIAGIINVTNKEQ